MTHDSSSERTKWQIHGERVVDENRHIRLSIASVELPNGIQFDQYVVRLPRCVMTIALDDAGENVLLIWRHRFIIDRWDWEIPGGYADPGEDPAAAAAREMEEETGWRPRKLEFLFSFQPMVGTADAPQDLYLARGADLVGEPHIDEAEAIRWVPLQEAQELIERGEIVGAATIMGVLHVLADQAADPRRSP
ncbi:NUDIX hydrolase [Actinomadura sp. NBRC 104425]|uniref:NUDIX domain-containing protein n=1 Tax=Actinomadura sp. NBRC 104425 TaxID=3032204 RepID=UPI0024A09C05|nr:NUDIX hydrolase [Actinomadura sp. NBRC 104425]GLZ16057.1 NUDIX hydrolase [Actinomadura sp. NBRC 104425]